MPKNIDKLRELVPYPNQYCPHRPHPKQLAFLMLRPPLWPLDGSPGEPDSDPAEYPYGLEFGRPVEPNEKGEPSEQGVYPYREVFFGGAAMGGKSDVLLMAALEYVHVPKYAALIVRRTYKQLSKAGAIMDRLQSWLVRSDAVWQASINKFRFPSGASIEFGYCESDRDVEQYQSAEFQAIFPDETAMLSEYQYSYLFSRLRGPNCPACQAVRRERYRAKHGLRPSTSASALKAMVHDPLAHVPLRMRPASNPGGVGHDWLRRRFLIDMDITIEKPCETCGPLARIHELTKHDPNRFYVPALGTDNPSMDKNAYEASLSALSDRVYAEQLRTGNWRIQAKGEIKREWFEIVDDYPREAVTLARAWDTAGTEGGGDWTVGLLMARTRDGLIYIVDAIRRQKDPYGVRELIRVTASQDLQAATQILQQAPGDSGKYHAQDLSRTALAGRKFHIEVVGSKKYVRAQPFFAAAGAHSVKLVRGLWNEDFLAEIETAGPDETAYNHDDQWDAAASAFKYLTENQHEYAFIPVPKPRAVQSPSQSEHPAVEERQPPQQKSRRWGSGAY